MTGGSFLILRHELHFALGKIFFILQQHFQLVNFILVHGALSFKQIKYFFKNTFYFQEQDNLRVWEKKKNNLDNYLSVYILMIEI